MTPCKNCNQELDETQDYCGNCGARVIRNRLSFGNLFTFFIQNFLNVENNFLQTIKDLFLRPENVIDGYVKGLRKRYNNPINFFAISLTISGLYIFVIQKFYPDAMKVYNVYENQAANEFTDRIGELLLDYNSLFYFFLIPLLAFISRVVFLRNGYNYTEHVVIYLYTMSLSAITSSFISLFVMWILPDYFMAWGLFFNFLMVVYHCYLLKRIFQLSGKQIVLKTLLFLVVFMVIYIVISFAVAFYMLFFTDMGLDQFTPPKS